MVCKRPQALVPASFLWVQKLSSLFLAKTVTTGRKLPITSGNSAARTTPETGNPASKWRTHGCACDPELPRS